MDIHETVLRRLRRDFLYRKNTATSDRSTNKKLRAIEAQFNNEVLQRRDVESPVIFSGELTTQLGEAAARGEIEVMDYLLESGANINNGSPLYFAVGFGNFQAVDFLLQHGADINSYDHFELLKELISRYEPGLLEPLHYLQPFTATLELLLTAGLDINASGVVDGVTMTCLHYAILAWPEIIPTLLDHGADPIIKDSLGRFPEELPELEPGSLQRNIGPRSYKAAQILRDASRVRREATFRRSARFLQRATMDALYRPYGPKYYEAEERFDRLRTSFNQ